MLEKLSEEEKSQRDHVQHVKARFEKEKDHWFPLSKLDFFCIFRKKQKNIFVV